MSGYQIVCQWASVAFIILCAILIVGGIIYGTIEDHRLDREFVANLEFERGDVVQLTVGGIGQVVDVWQQRTDNPYQVRVLTEDGFDTLWLSEIEVEAP